MNVFLPVINDKIQKDIKKKEERDAQALVAVKKEEKPKEITKCQYCGLENGNHKLSCPVIKVTMII